MRVLLFLHLVLFPTTSLASTSQPTEICFTKTQAVKISRTLKRCKADRKIYKVQLASIQATCETKLQHLHRLNARQRRRVHPAIWFTLGVVTAGVVAGVLVYSFSRTAEGAVRTSSLSVPAL
jgi:hypothetical protein